MITSNNFWNSLLKNEIFMNIQRRTYKCCANAQIAEFQKVIYVYFQELLYNVPKFYILCLFLALYNCLNPHHFREMTIQLFQ